MVDMFSEVKLWSAMAPDAAQRDYRIIGKSISSKPPGLNIRFS